MTTRLPLVLVLLASLAFPALAQDFALDASTATRKLKEIDEIPHDEGAKPALDALFERSAGRGGFLVASAGLFRPVASAPADAPAKGLKIAEVPLKTAPEKTASKQCCLDTLQVTPDGTAYRMTTKSNGWKFWDKVNVVEKAGGDKDGAVFNDKGQFVGKWSEVMRTRDSMYEVVQSQDGGHQLYTMGSKGDAGMQISRNGKVVTTLQGKFKIGADDKIYSLKTSDKGDEVVSIDPVTKARKSVAKVDAKFKTWEELVPDKGHFDEKGHNETIKGKPGYYETVKGRAGYYETIKGKPGYYQTVKGKPGFYQKVVDEPGFYKTVRGTPGYYETKSGTPGYYETRRGTPGYYEHVASNPGYYDNSGYWHDGQAGYDVWHNGTPDTQVWHDGTPDTQVWHGGTPDTQVWVPETAHQVWHEPEPDTQLWHDGTPDKQLWHEEIPDKQVWHNPVPDRQNWVVDSRNWVVDVPAHQETRTGERIPVADVQVDRKGQVYALQGGDVTDLATGAAATHSDGKATSFKVDGRGNVFNLRGSQLAIGDGLVAVGIDGAYGVDDKGYVYRSVDGVLQRAETPLVGAMRTN